MIRFIKKIAAFITIFILFSCEKVIDVDVPEGETLLVVDAWINNESVEQTIRLTTTAPVFSNTRTPVATGATVSLKDLNTGKIYRFNESDGSGNYTFKPFDTDSFNIVGHKYELSITYNGNNYTAVSVSNETTVVDTVAFQKLTNFGDTTVRGYAPWLFGKDIAGEKNYYWIKSYKNGVFFNQTNSINIAEDAGGSSGTDGLCFIPPVAYFSVVPFDEPLKLNDLFTVEVYSINKESFEYLFQLTTQVNNSQAGLFAVTPENLRTNIIPKNGSPRALGWFNIGKSSRRTFICKDIKVEDIYKGGYYCP